MEIDVIHVTKAAKSPIAAPVSISFKKLTPKATRTPTAIATGIARGFSPKDILASVAEASLFGRCLLNIRYTVNEITIAIAAIPKA